MRLPRPLRTTLPYLVASAILMVICLVRGRAAAMTNLYFCDALVYTRALAVWRGGGDPYHLVPHKLAFVYPPIFLKTLGLVSHLFPYHAGWYLYLCCFYVATLAIPWLLSTRYMRSPWLTPTVAMAVFAFQSRFFVEREMISGNIANLLYCLALLGGVAGLRRERWLFFYLAVLAAALIKPPFLMLLLLPLLAGKRQALPSAITSMTIGVVYSAQRFAFPQLYQAFQYSVYQRLVVKEDVGFGLYSFILPHAKKISSSHDTVLASAMHFAVMGVILAALFLLRGHRDRATVQPLWVPCLLVTAILANPRMMDYDAIVAVIPATYICVACLLTLPENRYRGGITAVALCLFCVELSIDAHEAICVLLLASIALVLWRMRPNPAFPLWLTSRYATAEAPGEPATPPRLHRTA